MAPSLDWCRDDDPNALLDQLVNQRGGLLGAHQNQRYFERGHDFQDGLHLRRRALGQDAAGLDPDLTRDEQPARLDRRLHPQAVAGKGRRRTAGVVFCQHPRRPPLTIG